jgi:DNA-binding GntR family transcriptional regulator
VFLQEDGGGFHIYQEHEQIFNAMKTGNASLLEQAMRDHLLNAQGRTMEALDKFAQEKGQDPEQSR